MFKKNPLEKWSVEHKYSFNRQLKANKSRKKYRDDFSVINAKNEKKIYNPQLCPETSYLEFIIYNVSIPYFLEKNENEPERIDLMKNYSGDILVYLLNTKICMLVGLSGTAWKIDNGVVDVETKNKLEDFYKNYETDFWNTSQNKTKIAESIYEFWITSIWDDFHDLVTSTGVVGLDIQQEYDLTCCAGDLATYAILNMLTLREEGDSEPIDELRCLEILTRMNKIHGDAAHVAFDRYDDFLETNSIAELTSNKNWAELRKFLASSLSLDEGWCLDTEDSLVWWGAPIPVGIKVVDRYESLDGIERDSVLVYSDVGELLISENRESIMAILHKWNVSHPFGTVHVGSSGIIHVSLRTSFNREAPAGASLVSAATLWLCAWSNELGKELESIEGFTLYEFAHPEKGIRYDYDELIDNALRNNWPFDFPIYTEVAVMESYAYALSEYGLSNAMLLPDSGEPSRYVVCDVPNTGISILSWISAEGSEFGPGLIVDTQFGIKVEYADSNTIHMLHQLISSKLLSTSGGVQLISSLTLEPSEDFYTLSIFSFFPLLVLNGMTRENADAKSKGEVMAFLAMLPIIQAKKSLELMRGIPDLLPENYGIVD